jgi:FOG: TPR repeat, SEL1 subfamily
MVSSGTSVTKDDTEAVRWHRLAADQGHVDAIKNLELRNNRS